MKIAGIGFRESATLADLEAALAQLQARPDALASIKAKAQTEVLRALANAQDLPLIALSENDIAGEQTLTCSPRIKARFATGSLAEACALVAARRALPPTQGDQARSRLIAPRVVTANGLATAALAERLDP